MYYIYIYISVERYIPEVKMKTTKTLKKLWPNECYITHSESANGAMKYGGWQLAHYYPHTDEFMPQNCEMKFSCEF